MSQGLIYKKLPLIMGEVGAIEKTRQTSQSSGGNYRFRGIDDIYAALQPALVKHGVVMVPDVEGVNREERQTSSGKSMTVTVLTVAYTLYAEDGSSIKARVVGEAMDTSDKSSNKAMSAALKYLALQVFCIPTEEEKDTEYQNHEPAPRQPSANAPGPAIAIVGGVGATYSIPIGKYKGKALSTIPINELNGYAAYVESEAKAKGKKIEGPLAELLQRIQEDPRQQK